jgi:hypothetical protein
MDRLKEFFEYRDGHLIWKVRRNAKGGPVNPGDRAGCLMPNGYIYINSKVVGGKPTPLHRIIWEMEVGPIPAGYHIDHIDGDKLNNRVENLRCVPPALNFRNQATRRNNTSGVIGVRFYKGAWNASIMVNRKSIYLGRFQSKNEAIAARKQAEAEYGFHPNHGRAA